MLQSVRIYLRALVTLGLMSCTERPEADPAEKDAVVTASDANDSVRSPTPMQGDVVLTASLDTTSNRPFVSGTTNLPDGAELSVSIHSVVEGTYQDRSVVQAGRYTAGPFGPLPNGSYSVQVFLSSLIQPQQVKAVIGENGEHLRGPLVTRESDMARVETKLSLTIGDRAAERARSDSVNETARFLYRELTALVALGRGMEALRNTDDLDRLGRCGREMRANMKRAEKALELAQNLPLKRRLYLGTAAEEVRGCVTCANDAKQWCAQAEGTLREERSER